MLPPAESGPGPVRIAPESLYMAILGTTIWKSWAHMGGATGSRNAAGHSRVAGAVAHGGAYILQRTEGAARGGRGAGRRDGFWGDFRIYR